MSTLLNIASGPWAWQAGAVAVLAVTALVVVVARLRKSQWLSGIGPQAFVALGGVAVSVHGLWGFATDTSHLPSPLAIAFIAVFDAAEMTLLVMMYRTANPKDGWTRELRLMHRTAWLLVGFSAAMNAVHAPNWWARPVLASVPALAAWLIELQLRSKLHHTRPHDGDETGRPGPARLLVLLWQHLWAAVFARFGLDARTSSSAIARAALVQRAARRVYRLRLILESGRPQRARRINRRRRKAQTALDRADVATDSGQALALVRRLAALNRADDVALLDYANPPAVLAMIEELAVVPAAERIESSALAAEAQDARQRAEAARQEAEDARQRAQEATATARQELEAARRQHAELREAEEGASQQTVAARQRAEAARQEEQDARQRAENIITAARNEAARLQQQAGLDLQRLRATAEQQQQALRDMNALHRQAEEQHAAGQAALQQVRQQVQEATLLRDRLHGDLAGMQPQAPEAAVNGDGPVWKSEAKQDGWTLYLHTLDSTGGQTEPSAADLATRYGIDPGNARNWVRDFRAARAAQLAAHPHGSAARTPAAVNGSDRAGAL
ncbi:hypothetical protein J7I98_35565 [Streptomyces sp. ISL-98]|uniref:hypothetical protein n=1 Tax=Streptomyces sp. ISL-98 TaxID=2819192 RepID=UPI001BEB699E|nr:hypothetical protein [Streptomyces sp. ISL-98]MBT2511050.1 hypothetical protein [Streptomyces sp. ISL-98]